MTQIEASQLGQSMVGKSVQSRLLTMLNDKGQKVMEPAQKVTGFEVVPSFGEYDTMLIVGGESVYYDTCIGY